MSLTKKPPILLVDDEPEVLFSLEGLLRKDFDVYTATSGEEALGILADHAIHVIMTDQRMPEMTGTELMGQVKTTYPEAIRIVFTGYSDIRAVIQAINSGGLFRYLIKPWNPDELMEVLHQAAVKYDKLVENRQFCNELRAHLQHGSKLANMLGTEPAQISDEFLGDLQEHLQRGAEILQGLPKYEATVP